MKKSKLLCIILMLVMIFILPVQVSAYEYNENDVIIDYLPGDIDGNGKITASDARLCIRAAASLETLTENQLKAADLDGNGEITSSNARSILRASAKIDTLDITLSLNAGQRIVIGPYQMEGVFNWEYTTDSDKTTVNRTYENNLPEGVIGSFDQFFSITTEENDNFAVNFKFECPWTGEVDYSFNLIVNISE